MIHTFPNTAEGEKDWQACKDANPGCDSAWSPDGYEVRTGDGAEPPPSIQEQIAELEAKVTQRMLREAALGIDRSRLTAIDQSITALRKKI